MKNDNLITYCGSYGGSCARWRGYTPFRDLVTLLAEWVDAQGYQHWMPQQVREFDYNEFRKGLAFFSKSDSWLVCERCCHGGDGNPHCEIRKCCKERKLDVCFDCDEFPCAITGKHPDMIKRFRQYKALGRSEWLRQQAEKATHGFEGHTKKYYQVKASKKPPEDQFESTFQ